MSKTQEIVVTAERSLVVVTESRSGSPVSEQQLQSMPVDDVLEVPGLKSGVVKTGEDMHVRGGRSGEVGVQIKGVPVCDPLAGGTVGVDVLGPARYVPPVDREQYERLPENEFLDVVDNPLSTFSIVVDRASYANMRRFVRTGQRPPASAIRIEELIN